MYHSIFKQLFTNVWVKHVYVYDAVSVSSIPEHKFAPKTYAIIQQQLFVAHSAVACK